jgi:hypothetical protein
MEYRTLPACALSLPSTGKGGARLIPCGFDAQARRLRSRSHVLRALSTAKYVTRDVTRHATIRVSAIVASWLIETPSRCARSAS